jgi:hypothetical protein
MLRAIFAGLKGFFNFEQSLVERVACKDQVDREIIQALFEAGSQDALPKDLAVGLHSFKVTRDQISRRIVKINKRLESLEGLWLKS